tara:strand:+ start:2732 stop:3979 length:1248 start_codon:yes stop_codon:yes gene_type:complete
MHNSSNKSKGYMPVPSGPNMTGFDMGKTSSLMEMMQTGGQTTAGGAALARALQMQKDQKRLERAQRREADRQKKGGLFGSVLGTGLGLVGGAIGLGPAGVALGTALGQGIGQKLGAGKSRDVNTSGTVFGQQSFRDVEKASRDFTRGIGKRALGQGLMAGATAGLTPGGGLYGQYNPLTSSGREGIKAGLQGLGVTGYTEGQGLFGFGRPLYEGSDVPLTYAGSPTFFDKAAKSVRGFLGLEDGGLIGYLEGGLTGSMGSGGQDNEENLSNIEEMLGFELTPQQEALFQARDTSAITRGAEQLGQGLLGMTGGQGLASAGTGFGAGQSAISQAVEGMQQSYDQGIADEAKAFESQVKGTAAELIGGGAEFKTAGLQPPTTTPSGVASFGKVETGPDGRQYIWLGDDKGWNFVGDL